MKKVLLSFLVVAAVAAGSLHAQSYQSAIGARLGVPFAASYKHFITEPGAIEVFAGFRGYSGAYSWFSANALYEHHFPIQEVNNLAWYVGGGAGIQFWSWKNAPLGGNTSLSVMGCLGLDYKVEQIPLNISLDWVPTLFVNGFIQGFSGGYGSLSARYVIN